METNQNTKGEFLLETTEMAAFPLAADQVVLRGIKAQLIEARADAQAIDNLLLTYLIDMAIAEVGSALILN